MTVLGVRLGLLIAALGLWEALPRLDWVDAELLPPFSAVAATVPVLLGRASIRSDLQLTGLEILIGFLLSIPVGAVLGVVTAESRYAGRVLDPLLFFLFTIPKSIFLPLTILVLGIGFSQKIAFAVLSTFLVLTFNFAAAVRSIRSEHLLVARSYGATRAQLIWSVYIPSMLPVLLEAVRVAVMFTVTAVLLAEMYASRTGIGHEIVTWGENFQMRQLLAGVVLIAGAAVTVNEAIRWLERGASLWRT
jgi:NitT/TauT family transport system permease protein